MKNKGEIKTPSKQVSGSDAEFETLRENYLKVKSAYDKAAYKRSQQAYYDGLVNRVSNELEIDKDDLDSAYKEDRRSLTLAFSKYNRAKTDMKEQLKTAAPYSAALSGAMGLLACFAEQPAVFVLFSVMFAGWGALNAKFGLSSKKEAQLAKEEIKAKALEFKDLKRLPAASV